ncbi:hypothetical protein AN958_04344 [Leucoagaricus sp. SymC.cos]|nr:hypothetical protein AN958_04344 [Leucoagaricus sp. SymC.cos]
MAAVYPAPPPTTNILEPAQRKQLLKSTQKLGALLGTTPRVLEPGSVLPPPLTPATKAFRREGKVFYDSSASSSRTSLSSEGESYILVPSPTDVLLRQHHKNASEPIAVEFPHVKADKPVLKMSSKRSHQRSRTTPQKLSQPLLYRLRSVPVPPPMFTPLPVDEKAAPPSPVSPITRNVPTGSARSKGNKLSESDRRRKMAKLTRTLGENIPPELVFGPPRSSSLAAKSSATPSPVVRVSPTPLTKVPSRRNRSATNVHRRRTESVSRLNSADAPQVSSKQSTSKAAATRSQDVAVSVASATTVNALEYGYRKEKEWSGEWNVKDMGQVKNVLRGLRAR